MTDQEWQTGARPAVLKAWLLRKFDQLSDRKMRLFGCACCRRLWHLLANELSRQAVEVAEQFADGIADRKQLKSARESALAFARKAMWDPTHSESWLATRAAGQCALSNGNDAGKHASDDAAKSAGSWNTAILQNSGSGAWYAAVDAEKHKQAILFRDIICNPFRSVALDPRWFTSTVVDLAGAIYNERAFDRMPILADALMDAGCDNEEIIHHCRGDGPHVRGCWVVDLLLGKE